MTAVEDPLFLSVEEVMVLHQDQLRLFGGSDGLRDRGVLEAAVAMPAATFDGVYLHSDLFEVAPASRLERESFLPQALRISTRR
ncbi:MAG TPA: hypothetical protein VGK73_02460 [Polyangiaceae bacterium]